MTEAKRCSCHSSSLYATLVRCPKCRHWSYDPGVGCERRKCAYVDPVDRYDQQRLAL